MWEWEESTFLGLKSLYQRFVSKPKQAKKEARQSLLTDHRAKLLLLARMLSGRNLGIFESDNRILCAEDRVFLPSAFHFAEKPEDNANLYEVKTIIAALALRDQWNGTVEDLPGFVEALGEEFPHLPEKIFAVENALIADEDEEEISLWKILGVPSSLSGKNQEIDAPLPGDLEEGGEVEIITEIEGKGQLDVEVLLDSEQDDYGEDMPIHTFEKAEYLEETSGLSRKQDDEDELEDHEESLQEVDMKEVMRSQERPRSIYRSDVILDGLDLEVDDDEAAVGVPYPEWNYRKREYREDWCFIQEKKSTETNPDWVAATEEKHASLVADLKRQFASLTSEYIKLKRQPVGNDFDIDAVIDGQVMLRTGQTPSEAIYLDQKRDVHDVSAVILLDLSYSTDAWVNDARVLDSIMETVYCVGEVIEDYIEGFAVAGFSSNTRRSCRFELIKDFQEPWEKAKQHFGTFQPEGYTRIGPALRHAQELLINEKASRKIVILVTDGRPCDYDRYEGTYGIKDVRKAIETGKRHGLSTHAFAIEKQATESFPLMFSRHHFDVVGSPTALSQYMSSLFSRLITG